MRCLSCLLLCMVCIFTFSVVAYAVTIPESRLENGVTIVETFNTKDLTETPRQFLVEWAASNRNALIYTNAMEWVFVIVPETASLSFVEGPDGSGVYVQMKNTGAVQYAKFRTESQTTELFELTTYGTLVSGAYTDCYCVVMGTYFDGTSFVFPDLGGDYMAEFEMLELRDNGEVFAGGSGTEEPSFWGKIWEWLTSFWDTLKNLILSLFVPDAGYFDSWFEELRSAWEAKVGGLGTLLDSIKQSFGSLKGSSGGIFVALPSGTLYDSSPDMRVNLLDSLQPFFSFLRPILTALIAILTVVRCYHRLTELTKT